MISRSASSVNSIFDLPEAVLLDLARHQVALGDLELLLLGVARELDHLHPVAQRRRDRVELVRGGDEQDLRQVERQVEVVVAEAGVLLGVEHLEHRAGRVAAEVGAHLVDLVDHQHRVVGAGVAHRADDRARASRRCRCGGGRGSRTRRARRPPRCARTRGPSPAAIDLPSEVLPTPGGPDEAEDRAAGVGLELAHGQELEDAVLDLLDVVVVAVEHLARLLEVEVVLAWTSTTAGVAIHSR